MTKFFADSRIVHWGLRYFVRGHDCRQYPRPEGWTVTEVTTQSALTRRSISKKKKLNARETIRAIPLTPAS